MSSPAPLYPTITSAASNKLFVPATVTRPEPPAPYPTQRLRRGPMEPTPTLPPFSTLISPVPNDPMDKFCDVMSHSAPVPLTVTVPRAVASYPTSAAWDVTRLPSAIVSTPVPLSPTKKFLLPCSHVDPPDSETRPVAPAFCPMEAYILLFKTPPSSMETRASPSTAPTSIGPEALKCDPIDRKSVVEGKS